MRPPRGLPFGMLSSDDLRALTERQREVLSIVVENKLYRHRDSNIPDIAESLGIAPLAVYKHLLEIEREDLCIVVVLPSDKGSKVYERLQLPPRPARPVSEALNGPRRAILGYLAAQADATASELCEELAMSEYAVNGHLRVLEAIGLASKRRGRAVKRGAPPYVYNVTPHGRAVLC